ncbi:MAG TPA: DUF3182 family protein [Microvirga sp.]|nr:DUF3182 family protein [Microvirga sp.]
MVHGVVVVYAAGEQGYARSHERATRIEIAKRLAVLKGFEFMGEYDPRGRYPGSVYVVPSDTLSFEEAEELGIRSEQDLFGGVVPHPFVATKVITHPLVEPEAHAPAGWSQGFAEGVHDVVLAGYSVFTREDARRAGARLLERGPVRIKPVRQTGGHGQIVVSGTDQMQASLGGIADAELSQHGLVLEENLADVTTYSVGQVRVADLVATYFGTQRLTPDNSGAVVYGGSDLLVVRGDFEALLRLDLPEEARVAVAQARVYDRAATAHYPGLMASRRNYDVAAGLDRQVRRRLGVLEQSWRLGGASGAEVAALEAFRADPRLGAVRASTVEVYGRSESPPTKATVYFRGTDERVGLITKYAVVEPYGHARG